MAPLRILETRREGVSPWAGTDAQAVYAQQDTAGYGPVRGNGSRPTGARLGAYVRVRTPTRQSQRVLHSFWKIGERPVGCRVKEKAPSWVLGACTQREAVGGDSPPGMLSVNPRLAVSEKDVQYYLLDFGGHWTPDVRGAGVPKIKAPS